jgi:hypothetical protein
VGHVRSFERVGVQHGVFDRDAGVVARVHQEGGRSTWCDVGFERERVDERGIGDGAE